MHYYVIEWENEEVDEPHRVYLELDRENRIRRKIEFYRVGLGYYYEDLCTEPVDIKELAGEADYGEVRANAFEIALGQLAEVTGNFVGMDLGMAPLF